MSSECCPSCFSDEELKQKIRSYSEAKSGACDFCGSQDQLAHAKTLGNDFEFLINSVFEKSSEDGSENLVELIQSTLQVFSRKALEAAPSELLKAIIDDESIYNGQTKYKRKELKDAYSDYWVSLRDDLVRKNRFFPKNELLSSLFREESDAYRIFIELADQLVDVLPLGSKTYRARISEQVLTNEEIGKPPADLATDGRVNPIGIPYLYVAEDSETAHTEIKPSNGSVACIAELRSSKKLKVINLIVPREKFRPTTFEDEDVLTALSIVEMLEKLSEELSNPIAQEKRLDYLPTQFFCEFIKSLNIAHGIKFKSSFTGKCNLVFFEPNDESYFTVENKSLVKVVSTSHGFESLG